MAKITKRAVDAMQPDPHRDVFTWDSELRGFGVRVKPSGVKTFLIQYRNVEGRTRRLVLGQYGALTPEMARDLARKNLTGVANGEDPSAERHAVRAGMSVSDVCDWYLEQAEAGRIRRNRRPIKASTLRMDRSRIETTSNHCSVLGSSAVSDCTTSRACRLISLLAGLPAVGGRGAAASQLGARASRAGRSAR